MTERYQESVQTITTNKILYKSGYKYQLWHSYRVRLPFAPDEDIDTGYIHFTSDGVLQIENGYAWDGPSGPTIDTKNFMRGSLEHDALFQLMRTGYLSQDYFEPANKRLIECCKADKMSWIRRQWVYIGVKYGSRFAADPDNAKKINIAP